MSVKCVKCGSEMKPIGDDILKCDVCGQKAIQHQTEAKNTINFESGFFFGLGFALASAIVSVAFYFIYALILARK